MGEETRCRVEWEERNRVGKGKKRGRDGRRNGKTIRVLRRCEKLAVFSELAYLLKLEMEKKIPPLGQFMRILGCFIECSFFSSVMICPFFPEV